jgi:hypothetical protein
LDRPEGSGADCSRSSRWPSPRLAAPPRQDASPDLVEIVVGEGAVCRVERSWHLVWIGYPVAWASATCSAAALAAVTLSAVPRAARTRSISGAGGGRWLHHIANRSAGIALRHCDRDSARSVHYFNCSPPPRVGHSGSPRKRSRRGAGASGDSRPVPAGWERHPLLRFSDREVTKYEGGRAASLTTYREPASVRAVSLVHRSHVSTQLL